MESRPEGWSQDGERDGVDDSQGSRRRNCDQVFGIKVFGHIGDSQGSKRLACLSLGCSIASLFMVKRLGCFTYVNST